MQEEIHPTFHTQLKQINAAIAVMSTPSKNNNKKKPAKPVEDEGSASERDSEQEKTAASSSTNKKRRVSATEAKQNQEKLEQWQDYITSHFVRVFAPKLFDEIEEAAKPVGDHVAALQKRLRDIMNGEDTMLKKLIHLCSKSTSLKAESVRDGRGSAQFTSVEGKVMKVNIPSPICNFISAIFNMLHIDMVVLKKTEEFCKTKCILPGAIDYTVDTLVGAYDGAFISGLSNFCITNASIVEKGLDQYEAHQPTEQAMEE